MDLPNIANSPVNSPVSSSTGIGIPLLKINIANLKPRPPSDPAPTSARALSHMNSPRITTPRTTPRGGQGQGQSGGRHGSLSTTPRACYTPTQSRPSSQPASSRGSPLTIRDIDTAASPTSPTTADAVINRSSFTEEEDDDDDDSDDDDSDEDDDDNVDEVERVESQVSMSMINMTIPIPSATQISSGRSTTANNTTTANTNATSIATNTTTNTTNTTTTTNVTPNTMTMGHQPSALWNMRTHDNASEQMAPRGLVGMSTNNESHNSPAKMAGGDDNIIAPAARRRTDNESEIDVVLYEETSSGLQSDIFSSKHTTFHTTTKSNIVGDKDKSPPLSSSPFSPSSPSSSSPSLVSLASASPTTPPPSSTKSSSLLEFLQVSTYPVIQYNYQHSPTTHPLVTS